MRAYGHTRAPTRDTPHEGVVRAEDGILHRRALRKLGVLLHVGDHRGLGRLDGASVAALFLSQHLCTAVFTVIGIATREQDSILDQKRDTGRGAPPDEDLCLPACLCISKHLREPIIRAFCWKLGVRKNGVREVDSRTRVVVASEEQADTTPPPKKKPVLYLEECRFPAAIYSHQPQLLPPANRQLEVLELEAGAVEGVA